MATMLKDIDLANLAQPADHGGLIVLVMGEPGAGKTTFGATMPAPVIASLEEGESSLIGRPDVRMLPRANDADEFAFQVSAIRCEKHDFRTLVIDSVTTYLGLVEADILETDRNAGRNPETLNQALGGYGAGQRAMENRAEGFCKYCMDIRRERGMNVVWIGHQIVETINPPDGASYDRYTLGGFGRAAAKFIQYADVVGVVRQQAAVIKQPDGRNIAKSTGAREFVCTPTPSAVTKNRLGITEPLPFTIGPPNPLAPWLPAAPAADPKGTK